ncbi:hypothetical protein ACIBEA_38995 [Streptomyces sp. NPDC051555]|uniref:hypothetical protein n=1 Tax=Streptomyces sp. NPDC051555 TaxID=3365657 RepID=UPI00379D3574
MAHRLLAAGLVLDGRPAASACGRLTMVPSSADGAPGAAAPAAPALAQPDGLPVRSHTSLSGFSREVFGPAWSDGGTVGLSNNQRPTSQGILAWDLAGVVRARDASLRLPPRGETHWWYAADHVRGKAKYRLTVSVAEKSAIRTALRSCPASGPDAEGGR